MSLECKNQTDLKPNMLTATKFSQLLTHSCEKLQNFVDNQTLLLGFLAPLKLNVACESIIFPNFIQNNKVPISEGYPIFQLPLWIRLLL